MGVPFNFTCIGVGTYICSRCGYELFGSSDKVQPELQTQIENGDSSPLWPRFIKALKRDSIVTVGTGNSTASASGGYQEIKIMCGKCNAPLGFEIKNSSKGAGQSLAEPNSGESVFKVPPSSLRFIQKPCGVPLSFLF